MSRYAGSAAFTTALVAFLPTALAATPREEERRKDPAPMRFEFSDLELGATPGGAQDIAFFRDRVTAGEVPHPNVFTPEGLFSEHDLPTAAAPCKQLLCITGQASAGSLIVQPEVRYIVELGFASGLDKSWRRPPIDIIAAVDKSGSMSGQPLTLVKESLRLLASQLGPDDRLGIVLYGDRSHVWLQPTPGSQQERLAQSIDGIESAGSTAMEEGLKVAYALAHEARRPGATTRVMLFTDERPNVGATDAGSFMGMAEAASKDGIGLTTIGVGEQFGAELATKVSSVRGGNLFFFPDLARMTTVFKDELDTLVTELAYDLEMTIMPSRGLAIAGVYGIPGQMLEWTADGGIHLKIATIFLSKRHGAIFVALKGAGPDSLPGPGLAVGDQLAWGRIGYALRGGKQETSEVELALVAPADRPVGLVRGTLLIDEVTALKSATALHHEKNDQEGAYQIVHALASILRQTHDPDLANERTLTAALEATLAKLSGHAGEPPPPVERGGHDPVSGLPR
ncbi:MAG: VWA domain-containing protein [Myxococcota bacterium]